MGVPLRSGLWQRWMRRTLLLAKSLSGSIADSMASIASQIELEKKLGFQENSRFRGEVNEVLFDILTLYY